MLRSQKVSKKEASELKAILAAIPSAIIGQDDGEVTALASDGVRVNLGNCKYAPASLLNYLRSHPNPSDW